MLKLFLKYLAFQLHTTHYIISVFIFFEINCITVLLFFDFDFFNNEVQSLKFHANSRYNFKHSMKHIDLSISILIYA